MNIRSTFVLLFLSIFSFSCGADELALSPAETAWLAEHPVIRLGVGTSFPPIQYVDQETGEDKFKGIAGDYVQILSEQLGVRMEIVYGITFEEALQRGRNKEIDLFPCIAFNEDRAEFLQFTEGYMENAIVIFANESSPFIGSIQDLEGLRIADVDALYIHKQLQNDVPGIEFISGKNVEDCLELLAFGKADAVLTGLVSGSYLIRKNNWSNIKIAAPTPYPHTVFRMAVRDDWPELAGIIDKVLNSISAEKKNEIYRKWISIRYEYGVNPREVTLKIFLIIGASLGIIAIILIWVFRLRREIRERKKAEKSLAESEAGLRKLLEEKETLLKEVYHRVKNNLTLVKSLINLQASNLSNEEDIEKVLVLGTKIDSMVLLHDKLTKSVNFTEINLREYVRDLMEELKKINAERVQHIRVEYDSIDVSFGSKTIIPLGLIITELFTNALKYGFGDAKEGTLTVHIVSGTTHPYILSVKNNGLPIEEGIDPLESESLGLKLVAALSEQLGGSLEIIRSPETQFIVHF